MKLLKIIQEMKKISIIQIDYDVNNFDDFYESYRKCANQGISLPEPHSEHARYVNMLVKNMIKSESDRISEKFIKLINIEISNINLDKPENITAGINRIIPIYNVISSIYNNFDPTNKFNIIGLVLDEMKKILHVVIIKAQSFKGYHLDLSTLIKPDVNDTFYTWMEKNNFSIDYCDGVPGSYSVKSYNFNVFIDKEAGMDSYVEMILAAGNMQYILGKVNVISKSLTLFKKITKLQIQEWFDKYCGEGRIWVNYQGEGVRLVIKERSKKYKMIQ